MNLFIKIRERILQSDFLKSVSVLFSGNVIANAISFLSVPILSRIYSQADFGDYAIVTSVASILIISTAFGLTSAIMAPKDDDESRKIITTAYTTQSIIISLFAVLLVSLYLLFDYKLYSFSGNYLLSVVFLYIYSLIYALFSFLTVFTNKQKKNRVLFWNALINSVALLVLTIPLGLLGFGGIGYILAASCSYLVADIQMIFHTHPFIKIKLYSGVKELYVKYKDFILFQYPSNILGTFTVQLPNQMFSRFFGNASLGGYAMCERLLGVPMRLIGTPISTVYFRQASSFVKENKDLSDFTYRLISRVLWVSLLPVILVLLFAKPILTFVLGEEWSSVGDITTILIVPYVLSFCSSCVTYCLVVLDKQKINLYITAVQLLLIASFTLLGYFLFHDYIRTLQFYAIAMILFHTFNLSVIFYHLHGHFIKFLRCMLVYLLITVSLSFLLGVL